MHDHYNKFEINQRTGYIAICDGLCGIACIFLVFIIIFKVGFVIGVIGPIIGKKSMVSLAAFLMTADCFFICYLYSYHVFFIFLFKYKVPYGISWFMGSCFMAFSLTTGMTAQLSIYV